MFDAQTIRKDFPLLRRMVHPGKPLVYLDSAATSQKPQAVLDSMIDYYTNHNANVHRGIHVLGDESTKMFYAARTRIAKFFGADPNELVLVHNTTEALNIVAYAWAEKHLTAKHTILSTEMEHHSNLVTWQQLAKRVGCKVAYVRVTDDGELDMEDFKQKLTKTVGLVALTHVSNALGVLNPVAEITKMVHLAGAKVVIDGAQSAPHLPIDFHALNLDFFAFSGHKMLAPMGIGGLLIRKSIIDQMDPFYFGGGMINEVRLEDTTFAELPDKFIAGTPDVASTVGLAAACDYLDKLGMKNVEQHDVELVSYALEKLQSIPELMLVGPLDPVKRRGSVAFVYKGVHAHDVAQILDTEGVAVRSGHHCTMPLHQKFNWGATTRASFNVYTTKKDIDALVSALGKVKEVFQK